MSAIAFPAARLRRRRRPPDWWQWIVVAVALMFLHLASVLVALMLDPSPGLALVTTGAAFLTHDAVKLALALRRLAAGSVDEINLRFWLALPGAALWIAGVVISILERV